MTRKLAKWAADANRFEDAMMARGVLSDKQAVHEAAQHDARNCPLCEQRVHPDNWIAHVDAQHPEAWEQFPPNTITLALIRTDGGTQTRARLSEETVQNYIDALDAGDSFPPIEVYYDGTDYWLADGFHRARAYLYTLALFIPAAIHQGTQRDAVLHSVGANRDHGLPRNNEDKRRAVITLLRDEEWAQWSDREIARRVGVSAPTVSSIRAELTVKNLQLEPSDERTYTTKHGTTATMNTAAIGERPAISDRGKQGVERLADIAPELVEPVLSLEIDLRDAKTLAAQPEEIRSEVLEKVRSGQAKNVKTALKEVKREQDIAAIATAAPALPENERWQLHHGDLLVAGDALPDDSIDCILTDPPYGADALPLYKKLTFLALRVLKPGGSLVVLTGQTHLPQVFATLSEYLSYHWTLAYLTLGGQSAQQHQRKVNTFWKPALLFTKGTRASSEWFGDVVHSPTNEPDKRYHDWQQSAAGISDLAQRVVMPGSVVLDPFCGTGTTGLAVLPLGCQFIGTDIDAQMLDIARGRLTQWTPPTSA